MKRGKPTFAPTDPRDDAFIRPPAVIAGKQLRPFSLGSLNVCRKLGLTMITDGQVPTDSIERERQLVAWLWVHAAPLEEVIGAMQDPEIAAKEIEQFGFTLPLSALNDIVDAVQAELEVIGASAVEIEERDSGGRQEEPPPNS